jgi:hypothetical protein
MPLALGRFAGRVLVTFNDQDDKLVITCLQLFFITIWPMSQTLDGHPGSISKSCSIYVGQPALSNGSARDVSSPLQIVGQLLNLCDIDEIGKNMWKRLDPTQ